MDYNKDNIFAKILRGEIPCNKVYENEHVIAFHDLHPSAPTHVLVLPKKECMSFDDFVSTNDASTVDAFFKGVQKVASVLELESSGYRLIMNHGSDASQTVPHFHVHILGKKKLGALVAGDEHHS
ncbi:MAG: HIT domain-containing protein [Alphaproteobacteria bacterium]|jgi:histidine triad (HIT) family protein|nr:HIT domain-containing protein [Candidatus Jidaibacter sp.]